MGVDQRRHIDAPSPQRNEVPVRASGVETPKRDKHQAIGKRFILPEASLGNDGLELSTWNNHDDVKAQGPSKGTR